MNRPASRKKILCIDDTSHVRLLVQRLLSADYAILEADNGLQGIDQAEIERPDAAVRRKILRTKAARGGVRVPDDCIDLLVENVRGSVRDLEGALIQLVATSSLLKRPIDPALTTPGVARALVFVFDAEDTGPGMGGTPLAIVELFADTPRGLAVSPDRKTVYAAGLLSGHGFPRGHPAAWC